MRRPRRLSARMRCAIASRQLRGSADIAALMAPAYPGTYTYAPRPRSTARTMASPTTVGSTGRTRAEPSPSAISVAMIAGMTTVTAMSLPRSSPRSDSLSPMTACLVAEYVAPPGDAILPATEAALTMCPRPRRRIRARASLEPVSTPPRLTAIWMSVEASLSSANSPTC
jgi:hypothetical protein